MRATPAELIRSSSGFQSFNRRVDHRPEIPHLSLNISRRTFSDMLFSIDFRSRSSPLRLVHGSGSPECTPFPFLHRLLSPIFVGIWTLAVDATKNTGDTRLPLWVTDAMLGALFPVSSHTLPLADDDVDMYYVS